MTITIADGRGALWQWDTGRRLHVGSGVEQIHYQNRALGRSVDVDVGADGTAIIPDELLQDCHTLTAYVYVTDDTGAYTMEQQDFIVHKRAKPAGYVYTPTDQMTLQTIQRQIGDLAGLTTEAKDTLVAAINEAARTGGGAGSMDLRVADGYVQYSTDGGMTWTNLIAMAELKGADGSKGDPGAPGKDGHSPVVTATKSGKTTTISVDGTAIATVEDGKDGADGKSAYQYAVDGGYTGTEAEFAEKLAQEQLVGTTNDLTPTQVYDAVSAGIPVKVQYTDSTYGILSFTAFNVSESRNVIVSEIIAYGYGVYMLCELLGDKSSNAWGFNVATLVQKTDIPSALPNPNALTIKIGSTTVTYDGSAAKTVEIADGSEVSY